MNLNKRQRRLWAYKIRQLKKHFNPGVPVHVKTVPWRGWKADCSAVIKFGRLVSISIRVNRSNHWDVKIESLIHEWAHAMDWAVHDWEGGPKKDHGETWGVWYAKIYNHLIDECWDEMRELGLLRKDGTQ